MSSIIAQHSSASNEHYTPAPIIEAARALMGGIELDPASNVIAQRTVSAERWHGRGSPWGEDGLAVEWVADTAWLNPPGGRAPPNEHTRSSAALWWIRLAAAWENGAVKQAVFLGFSLEILRSTQGFGVPSAMRFPFCVPRRRIRFNTIDASGKLVSGDQPTNANVIVWLPPRGDTFTAGSGMMERFGEIGEVVG